MATFAGWSQREEVASRCRVEVQAHGINTEKGVNIGACGDGVLIDILWPDVITAQEIQGILVGAVIIDPTTLHIALPHTVSYNADGSQAWE
jgi:hypothetical protein